MARIWARSTRRPEAFSVRNWASDSTSGSSGMPLSSRAMSGPRRFVHARTARLSECGPDGRLRLDAVAAWMQDVAADDVADAGLTEADGVWIMRRLEITVTPPPR